jgi:glycosyltransferase involved in cell wall biosynthesis
MHPIGAANEHFDSRCDVLHVVWSGDPSGIISQLAGILRLARNASPFVHRACFLEGRGVLGDALVTDGLAIRLGLERGWGPLGLSRLAGTIRRVRPRVIHFHVPAFGPILVAFATLPGALFVWTQHDPGVLTGSRRFDVFYRLFRHRFSLFVAPSAAIVPALEAHGVPRSRIAVVPHGLTVAPSSGHAADDRRASTSGTVARLHREKSLEVLIDVTAELVRRGVECRVLVVGDGPDRERLCRYADEQGVGKVVSFAGEQVDVEPCLDQMDVFLVTSSVEIAGLAPLEAMARGVPVVSLPSVGGMAEIVARGGRLLAGREVNTAADAVGRLLASSTARAELRARGAEVAAEYSLDRTLSALDALYSRELASADLGNA